MPPLPIKPVLNNLAASSLKCAYHLSPVEAFITRNPEDPSIIPVTVSVTNVQDHDLDIEEIRFVFSVGGGMFDLTENDGSIKPVSVIPTWSFTYFSKGVYTAQPVPPAKTLAKGETVVFQLDQVEVNMEMGTAIFQVSEYIGDDQYSGQLEINKIKSKLDINSFQALPTSIFPGGQSELSWACTAASEVTLHPGEWPPLKTTDSVEIQPLATTRYTLKASGEGPSVQRQFTVEVTAVTITSFKADLPIVTQNAACKLSWEIANADSITLAPGDFSGLHNNDEVTVHPAETTMFTLTATQGDASDQKQLQITVPPVAILLFRATPDEDVKAGSDVLLEWKTQFANEWAIEAKSGKNVLAPIEISGDVGSVTVNPENDTTYTLKCAGFGPDVSDKVEVKVKTVEISLLTVNPEEIEVGGSATIAWETKRAVSASLNHDLGDVDVNGTMEVTPDPEKDTNYKLTCHGPNGPVEKAVKLTVNSVRITKASVSYPKEYGDAILNYKTTHADRVTIECKSRGMDPKDIDLNGSYNLARHISDPTQYTLKAYGIGASPTVQQVIASSMGF